MSLCPINRWVTFPDSWSCKTIENLLNDIHTENIDLVIDPFVGCGTTPVVASKYGYNSFSTDINQTSILSAKIKLFPPSLQQLKEVKTFLHKKDLNFILEKIISFDKDFLEQIPQKEIFVFIIVAALYRINWHIGVEYNFCSYKKSIEELLTEIETDINNNPASDTKNYIFKNNFPPNIDKSLISKYKNLAFISSPPFFGSNINPRRTKIDSLINSLLFNIDSNYHNNSCSYSKSLTIKLKSYYIFLEKIINFIIKFNFKFIALDMNSPDIQGTVERFDEFIAGKLKAENYKVKIVDNIWDKFEQSKLIYAKK